MTHHKKTKRRPRRIITPDDLTGGRAELPPDFQAEFPLSRKFAEAGIKAMYSFGRREGEVLYTPDNKFPYNPEDNPDADDDIWESTCMTRDNNCYTYAVDEPDIGWSIPGELKDLARWTRFMENVGDITRLPGLEKNLVKPSEYQKTRYRGALEDGLVPHEGETFEHRPGFYLVAMAFRPPNRALKINPDFHWYRLNNNGTWTHKQGSCCYTNLDRSGEAITDPRTADRGLYTDFAGFFYVPSRKFCMR